MEKYFKWKRKWKEGSKEGRKERRKKERQIKKIFSIIPHGMVLILKKKKKGLVAESDLGREVAVFNTEWSRKFVEVRFEKLYENYGEVFYVLL